MCDCSTLPFESLPEASHRKGKKKRRRLTASRSRPSFIWCCQDGAYPTWTDVPVHLFSFRSFSLFTILLHCLLIDNKLFFISRGVIALRVATTWIRLWGFYFIIKKFSSCFRFNFIFLLSKNAFSFVGEFVSRVMLDLIIWGKFWWFFFSIRFKNLRFGEFYLLLLISNVIKTMIILTIPTKTNPGL